MLGAKQGFVRAVNDPYKIVREGVDTGMSNHLPKMKKFVNKQRLFNPSVLTIQHFNYAIKYTNFRLFMHHIVCYYFTFITFFISSRYNSTYYILP